MAAAMKSIVNEVRDLTECSICTEMFCNPKMLPCFHTFCLKCIEQYCKKKKTGDTMPCPMCRKEFIVPIGGLSKLNANFFIEKLIAVQSASRLIEVVNCDVCLTGKQCKVEASSLIGDPSTMEAIRNKNRRTFCDKHPTRELLFFCRDCKIPICITCFLEKHDKQNHECCEIGEIVEEFKKGYYDDASKLLKLDKVPKIQFHPSDLDVATNLHNIIGNIHGINSETPQLTSTANERPSILAKFLSPMMEDSVLSPLKANNSNMVSKILLQQKEQRLRRLQDDLYRLQDDLQTERLLRAAVEAELRLKEIQLVDRELKIRHITQQQEMFLQRIGEFTKRGRSGISENGECLGEIREHRLMEEVENLKFSRSCTKVEKVEKADQVSSLEVQLAEKQQSPSSRSRGLTSPINHPSRKRSPARDTDSSSISGVSMLNENKRIKGASSKKSVAFLVGFAPAKHWHMHTFSREKKPLIENNAQKK